MHLLISGRVQRVWYRDWMVAQARALGVSGWVRNRGDGQVEALVSGPDDAVDRLIAACHRGPERAKVSGIEAAVAPLPDAMAAGMPAFDRIADA
jgi:acylphosphatase